eukprot:10497672-Prorocentrum_lima.AAC.1
MPPLRRCQSKKCRIIGLAGDMMECWFGVALDACNWKWMVLMLHFLVECFRAEPRYGPSKN